MAVPYYADQPFWGRRLHAIGVGAPPLPRSRLGADSLAERLTVLDDEKIRRRAGEIGEAMRSERGLETASDFIVRRLDRG
jgi:UDP:flavonoid glycosyltransferase YjiC (YdhE family)